MCMCVHKLVKSKEASEGTRDHMDFTSEKEDGWEPRIRKVSVQNSAGRII